MGYIIFIATILSLLGISYLFRKQGKLYPRHTGIVLYNGLTIFVYLVSRKLHPVLESSDLTPFLAYELQIGLLILCFGIVIQWVIVNTIHNSFYKLLFATLINAVMSFVLLFWVGHGIINIVWFLIFTGVLGVYIFLTSVFNRLREIIRKTNLTSSRSRRKEILEDIRAEMGLYIKVITQGVLALGAAIGVSMSILFRQGEISWNDLNNLSNAVSIVVAYGAVGLGFMIWFLKPYMDNYTDVRYYFQDFDISDL